MERNFLNTNTNITGNNVGLAWWAPSQRKKKKRLAIIVMKKSIGIGSSP